LRSPAVGLKIGQQRIPGDSRSGVTSQGFAHRSEHFGFRGLRRLRFKQVVKARLQLPSRTGTFTERLVYE
jgi:hypothetical protein